MESRFLTFIILILMLLVAGCDSSQKKTEPQKFEDLYPGELAEVTQIQLLNGSDGSRVTVTDQEAIHSFIEKIKEATFIPDENQEEREGYRYAITLMEEDVEPFTFGVRSVGDTYYYTEPDILPYVDELFLKFDEEPSE
ncbi:hypothetical protein [uncultured Planococcus sp.]|uniref:hypothetical protein n=1 Tax=Planococcus donghaensis TaxID=414778 RepID=UPI00262C7E8E|nr:hypothetical protein [uncultured Planococcus sp.]